jgi:dipeptidyl aminopeptidase/acylaminoacyl peptidase
MINKSSPRRGVFLGVFISLSLLLTFTGVNGQADRQISTPVIDQTILDAMRENMHIGITPDLSSEIGLTYSPEDYAPKVTSSGEWGKLIIQAYVSTYPANAEIFTENGNGTNPVRLTDSPGFDGSARLSPDESKIVFVSTRDGDSEIYIMDIDGSDLVQVTFNTFTDSRPYWSPDGSQLVYAANERGYYEIYRINTDGSGRVRLSNYNAGFNAYEPAWAPDGSMIVYVLSDRVTDSGGTYTRNRLYRMDLNGSNQRKLCEYYEVSYAGDLVWSDDSRYLSFDDVNYYSIVSRINIYDRQNPEPSGSSVPQVPGHIVDQWNAGFSPTRNEILYTNVHYEFKSNHFIIIEMTPMIYCLPGKECRREPLQATLPFSFDPSMIQYDFSPPVSTMDPLPEYSRGRFMLSWGAEDVGLAGIYGFYLNRAFAHAPSWIDVPLSSSLTINILEDGRTPGNTVYYRARAYDTAGNLEDWPSVPEWMTKTTIFRWFVKGSIFDNRDSPVLDAAVDFLPTPLKSPVIPASSNYIAYLSGSGIHQLDISSTGYISPPSMSLDLRRDLGQDYYLASNGDLISNGTFESGVLDGWTAGGDLSSIVNGLDYFTGQYSMMLGQDCGNVCLSQNDGIDTGSIDFTTIPAALYDEGNLHVLFRDDTSGTDPTHYAYRSVTGVWTLQPDTFPGEVDAKHLFVDMYHTAYAFIIKYDWTNACSEIILQKKPVGEEWSSSTISCLPGQHFLDAVVDHDGKFHTIYRLINGTSNDLFYEARLPDGSWEGKVMIDSMLPSNYVVMEVDDQQSIHILWEGNGYFYQKLAADGVWGHMEKLNATPDTTNSYMRPVLISDTQRDRVYIFWPENNSDAFYLIKDGSSLFSNPILFPSGVRSVHPIIDRLGSVHFNYNSKILFPDRNVSEQVTSLTNIGWLDYDQDNRAIALKYAYHDGIYLYSATLASSDSTATLSQDVTIPADMNKPTLSFMTQINGGGPLPGTSFDVVIIDGGVETAVFSENTNHLWEHHWVAMDDYLGKTVTVKFVLDQKAGEPVIHVDLDDVSLSGWNMLSVSSVAPSLCLNDTTPITVTGVNFATSVSIYLDGQLLDPASVVWVNDQTVTINLPVGYQPGVYDLTVGNPGGFQYTLPHAMIVGCPVFIPCAIK